MVKKGLFLNKFIILGIFTSGIFTSVFSMETDSDQERKLGTARAKDDSAKKAKHSPEKPRVPVSPEKRLAPSAPTVTPMESEIQDPEGAASVAGNPAFGSGGTPTKKRKGFSLDRPILPDAQAFPSDAGAASALDFHGFKESSGSALSTPQHTPKRTPTKLKRTPGVESPTKTPPGCKVVTTGPETPGFGKIDDGEFLSSTRGFIKFMDYFVENIREFGDKSDLFVSSIKKINFEGHPIIDMSELRRKGNLVNYLAPLIASVIPNDDNDHVINLIRFYYYLKIKESLKNEVGSVRARRGKSCRRKIVFEPVAMDVSCAEATSSFSDDESDDTGVLQVAFGDDDEDVSYADASDFYSEFNKQLAGENGAALLFNIVEKSNYGIYLFGARLRDCTSYFALSYFPPWFRFVCEIIERADKSKFSFAYDILNKKLLELRLSDVQAIYDSIISLITSNIKEGSLLSYDFKPMLLSAKKIEKLPSVVKGALNLDLIVLFRDDHILNLIYEGTRSDKSACRLAGGHFPAGVDSMVINRDPSEQGRDMRVCHVTDLTFCSDCGVSYTRFNAQWSTSADASSAAASASGACSASSSQYSKESTTFPDRIKQNFHKYVKRMFDVVARPSACASDSVTLLSRDFQSSQAKTVCLFRHKATFFNEFSLPSSAQVSPSHDHDIYVSMVIFNEDGIDVIWTCYLLGVFIVDWSAEIESAISDPSSTNIQICGVQFEKAFVSRKIFEVYKDIESKRKKAARLEIERQRAAFLRVKKRKSKSEGSSAEAAPSSSMSSDEAVTYSFVESDGNTCNLIGLGNGIYLKIRNDDFERIGRGYVGLPNVQTKPESNPPTE
ncbi:MAG: hypothetical protein WC192_04265 [Candidatus Babeliales bacterium]|jgi:hypothetical protein